jgi:D-glycero-beta-D-manno-heptose 1-phosphate adenylyltransferase
MKQAARLYDKIYTRERIQQQVHIWRLLGKKIVFTNGVFDIIHAGHLSLLAQAASFADILVVGINSDTSVKRLKGEHRPVNNEPTRTMVLAAFLMTDAVVVFEEDTPFDLINVIKPDVLVKGGDYTIDTIIGAPEVIGWGGSVQIINLEEGLSTTATIEKIQRGKHA